MNRLENLKRNPLKLIAVAWIAAACGGNAGGPEDTGSNPNPADGGFFDAAAPKDSGPPDAGEFAWPVPTGPITISPHESWKNRVSTDDLFLSEPSYDFIQQQPRWVKFAVLMRDPSKVYFQNSYSYPFHYEFATERLNPFLGLSRAAFDELSLHEAGQEVILGAVLVAPQPEQMEYAIQLVRADPYHPEMVRIVFELVTAGVDAPSGTRALYFPTYEQAESAQSYAAFFAQHGIELGSPERWLTIDGCYSAGWAFGKLVYVAGSEIAEAYASGALTAADILLTDGVPAEVPYVAGIISLAPSTPNSHVAILSKSYLIPFAYVASEDERAEIMALAGREVLYRAQAGWGGCDVKVLDVGAELGNAQKMELLELKELPPVQITPKATRGAISASAEEIGPGDVRHFGGKAAHFGLLRDAIPTHSPQAIAFSFDLFDAFMNQTIASGKTLKLEIAERLAMHTEPLDIRALRQDLATIRETIKEAGAFEPALAAQIEAALEPFDPMENIRFRSSSNAEDGVTFSGAGLYDSFSGCLADDLDQDEEGPSLCDPSELKERGVYRAIKKVFAAFYNDNAVLERIRHHLPEDQVGMALLVHHSFPDEIELANGVATVRRMPTGELDISMVSQLGALSITNPEGNAQPEVVRIYQTSLGSYPSRTQGSSLVPLGGFVMEWDRDYKTFAEYFASVASRYLALEPSRTEFLLDFEYKKVAPGQLVVKQVRPLPLPSSTPSVTTYMVDEETRYCVHQGEYGDVFANHRMKSIWTLHSRNQRLTSTNLAAQSIFDQVIVELAGATDPVRLEGDPASFAESMHRVDGTTARDSFRPGGDAYARRWELIASPPLLVAPSEIPVITVRDGSIDVEATYDQPVPYMDWDGMPASRTTDQISLTLLCPDTTVVTAVNLRVEEMMTAGAIAVRSSYYFPEYPKGPTAGYTAPLYKWDQTTITGLTTQPIVLYGYWSQTYRPGHHNFSSDYIFEPQLEENIPAEILTELEAANIRYIFGTTNGATPRLYAIGFDGQFRQL